MQSIINAFNAEQRGELNLILSVPFIYGMAIPITFLYISLELYQRICFKLYGLEIIDIKEYVHDKRWRLSYLDTKEKIQCLYCSYANGVLEFAKAVANETERMWCPIQDKTNDDLSDLAHRKPFARYNDKQDLENYLATKSHVKSREEELITPDFQG